MAKIKVELEKGETIEEVENKLIKALDFHRNGDVHKEEFHDPAMHDLASQIERQHRDMFAEMLDEILNALDSEYQDGYQ